MDREIKRSNNKGNSKLVFRCFFKHSPFSNRDFVKGHTIQYIRPGLMMLAIQICTGCILKYLAKSYQITFPVQFWTQFLFESIKI